MVLKNSVFSLVLLLTPFTVKASTSFLYHDSLGSVETIIEDNQIQNKRYFSAFGEVREVLSKRLYDSENEILAINRGYTDHEHLMESELIHMNGRVYDPKIARVISADPYVPNLNNYQDFNRYSYVKNNPLNLIDRNGYTYEQFVTSLYYNYMINSNNIMEAGVVKVAFGIAESLYYDHRVDLVISLNKEFRASCTSYGLAQDIMYTKENFHLFKETPEAWAEFPASYPFHVLGKKFRIAAQLQTISNSADENNLFIKVLNQIEPIAVGDRLVFLSDPLKKMKDFLSSTHVSFISSIERDSHGNIQHLRVNDLVRDSETRKMVLREDHFLSQRSQNAFGSYLTVFKLNPPRQQ